MSRQSNEFQAVMKVLYEHISGSDAVVTESAELLEPTSGALREIDVLIERVTGDMAVRVAVECRDRAAKDDVMWVDQVIGKFADLPVNKVILISSSGFTESAARKAAAHSIEVCTVEALSEKDWPKEFTLLGVARLNRADELVAVTLNMDPPADDAELTDRQEVQFDNQPTTTLAGFLGGCFRVSVQPRINDHLAARFLEMFTVLADLNKTVIVDAPTDFGGNPVIFINGEPHRIRSAVLHVRCRFSYDKAPLRHLRHGDYLVSTTKLASDSDGRRINIIQSAGPKRDTGNRTAA